MSVSGWSTLRLGDALTPNTDVIAIDPFGRYQQVTIKLWGRGVLPRGEINGADIKGTARTRVRSGQFIVSKIDARNGAMGIVPPELDGALASNDFPAFDVDSTTLRPSFLSWFSRTAAFVDLCKRASEGTTNRVRLSQERMLDLRIQAPSPDEQDRIVATLDAAAARVAEAQRLCREIDEEADALCRSILSDPRHPTTPAPMRELVTLRPPDVDVKAQESYHFAGIYCFGKGMFRGQTRLGAEFSYDTLSRVRAGDFTYPKLMAWEGALCVVPPECDGLYVSTEYPVFAINSDQVLPDVLDVYFRSPEVWPKLSGTSKGTNVRRRRLNPQQFLNYVMPLPKPEIQKRVAEVRTKVTAIKAQHIGLVTEIEALMPAILDRAFKGELSTAAVLVSPTSESADATPVIAGRIAARADTVPMFAGTASVLFSAGGALADTAPMSAITAPAHTSTIAGKPGMSAHPARSMGADAVHTWNIADFAAIQAAIVYRERDNPTLGTKKLYKLGYLTAAAVGAKLVPAPLKMPAGPFNTEGQSSVEVLAVQRGWFTHPGRQVGSDPVAHYRPGASNAEACAMAKRLLAENTTAFERIMTKAKDWNSKQAELYATTHAAWNDLVAAGETITDVVVINRFYEWSEEKTKFSESDIRGAMATLRSIGLQPTGGGPLCVGAGEPRLFSNPPAQS